jgi:hypothetical protein
MREVPPALGWTVLGLVFLDELLLVAAAWVAAAETWGWLAGLIAGLLVVAVWFTFASPKARYGGPVVRPVTKMLVIVGAYGGLALTGHNLAAMYLLLFSVVINWLALLPSIARLAVVDAR